MNVVTFYRELLNRVPETVVGRWRVIVFDNERYAIRDRPLNPSTSLYTLKSVPIEVWIVNKLVELDTSKIIISLYKGTLRVMSCPMSEVVRCRRRYMRRNKLHIYVPLSRFRELDPYMLRDMRYLPNGGHFLERYL